MKKFILFLLTLVFFAPAVSKAQDITTVEAKNSDISDNLDLKAVASLFGEAKDLEDFEKKLNDPDLKVNNLDLNEDGEVDYLRVVETGDDKAHVVVIQAVIGEDQYQDVATIDVVKDNKGETKVQVVGDVYMYGPDYIIQPVYVRPPVIFTFFWGAYYRPWHSPYHWGYYPHHFHPWHPYPPHVYHNNITININVNNTYRNTNVRLSQHTVNLENKIKRNDFAKQHPDKSYQNRNKRLSGTNKAKSANKVNKAGNVKAEKSNKKANTQVQKNSRAVKTGNKVQSTGRKTDKNWKPSSGNKTKQATYRTGSNAKAKSKPSSSKRKSYSKPVNHNTHKAKPASKSKMNKSRTAASKAKTKVGRR